MGEGYSAGYAGADLDQVYSQVVRLAWWRSWWRRRCRLRFSHKHFAFAIPIIPGILFSPAPAAPLGGELLCGVERLTSADRACAVAAAAAQDLNDEFTIILNSASESVLTLEPGHPARLYLADIQSATQRCVWKVSGLLNYSAREGVHPVSVPFERLLSSQSKIGLI